MPEQNKVLDGVGQDAEIVTNKNGGKQSKSPMALYLVDTNFLMKWCENASYQINKPMDLFNAIINIARFMNTGDSSFIGCALTSLEGDYIQMLIRIAKVLQYGADRYEPNNWRLIPQESHLNHALIHILAEIMGDAQDDHTDHALCRLMMAMSTSRSPWFDYNDYVLPKGEEVESKLEL